MIDTVRSVPDLGGLAGDTAADRDGPCPAMLSAPDRLGSQTGFLHRRPTRARR